jgi:hypothetical protein
VLTFIWNEIILIAVDFFINLPEKMRVSVGLIGMRKLKVHLLRNE